MLRVPAPILWSSLAVVAVLVACGKTDPQQAAGAGAPQVGVVVVQPQRVALTTELPGRTAATLVAEVRPQVTGHRPVAPVQGGRRGQGRPGALPDRSGHLPGGVRQRARGARQGRGEPATARLKAERYRELVDDQGGEPAGRRRCRRRAAAGARPTSPSARAAVETARINLGYTAVTAPISGRIGKSTVTAGRAGHRQPGDRARHGPAARPDLRRRHAVERRPAAAAPRASPAASCRRPATTAAR